MLKSPFKLLYYLEINLFSIPNQTLLRTKLRMEDTLQAMNLLLTILPRVILILHRKLILT